MNTFGCPSSNYKVVMDGAGNLSGYAWSSNIGWVDANPTSGYPDAPAHGLRINMGNGMISGWMRACGGAANMPAACNGGSVDGWDGWIKITDAKVVQGGVIKNDAETEGGWAWGGDVVGWVQFYNTATDNGVIAPHVDCDLTANPSAIVLPESSTLTWSCNSYATVNGCSIDSTNNLPTSGNRTVSPSVNATYTLSCRGLGGPSVKTAEVRVGSQETGTTSSGTLKVRIKETNPGQ
jgi:hypothetical protein